MNTEYVQYGCGWSAPEGWLNFDASPTLRFERIPVIGKFYTKNAQRFPSNVAYGDIVRGLPLSNNSCKGIYCSHVLEHLALEDFRLALRNTYRLLEPGGIFRLVMPDLSVNVRKYLESTSANPAVEFLSETMLGRQRRFRGLKMLMASMGNNEHLWLWDYKSLAHELEQAGFQQIRRAEFGDAEDPMFARVEELSRWQDCLGAECRK